MAKNLVIVESPAKAKTINKFLGRDFVVKASMGHVCDLPPKKFGVDIAHGFKPEYDLIRGRAKVVDELKKAAASAENIYLAPDPDREGEAIAWHLKTLLKNSVPEDNFFRVTYHEITKTAIESAFRSPAVLDMGRVDSQQARRVLDRIVGYRISPLLWRRIPGAASAGRVQSVALRLVCEREAEIEQFKPEEYWLLGLKVRKQIDPRDPFNIRLAQIDGQNVKIRDAAEADRIRAALQQCALQVARIKEKEVRKHARPPYITSTLQQAGSSVYSFSPSRTMRIAQQLYEGIDLGEGTTGLITYMRTDSVSISAQAAESCRELIAAKFGREYLPDRPNVYKNKSASQEAHEAIRPTDVHRTPESLRDALPPEALKLYKLIWERFVASQMAPAVIVQRLVVVDARPETPTAAAHTYLFRVSASQVVFPGYMKVSKQEMKAIARKDGDDGEAEEASDLPPLSEGEMLDRLEWLEEQKFTQPPPRFSEASLVKVLEENGVGRPSTYAQILSTLDQRGYVGKEKRMLIPTELGRRVNEFLVSHLDALFNVRFTAEMEKKLDEIEEGKQDWVAMLGEFYGLFEQWLSEARGPKGDEGEALRLMAHLKEVKEWVPASRRGGRVFDDKKFMVSMEKQLQQEDSKLSKRQVDTLKRLVVKYIEQLPSAAEQVEELGLRPLLDEEAQREPPAEESIRKLALLEGITFDEPRKVGKRTYDDGVFSASLRGQVQEGRRLTENQTRYLDRLLVKYREQIPDFDRVSEELGLQAENGGEKDVQSGPLLELMRQVKTWKDPVKRGRRTWDDKSFFDSLDRQFKERQSLSPKQQQSLKRMAGKYADQIPDFDQRKEELGLVRKGESAK